MAVQHPIQEIYNDDNSLKTKKISNKKQEKRVITLHSHRHVRGRMWPRALLQAMKEAKRGRKKRKKLMKKKLTMGQGKIDESKQGDEKKIQRIVVEWDCARSIEEDASTSSSLSTSTTVTGMTDEFTSQCTIHIGDSNRITPCRSSSAPCGSITFLTHPIELTAPTNYWKRGTLQNGDAVKVTGNIWLRVVPNLSVSQKQQLKIQ